MENGIHALIKEIYTKMKNHCVIVAQTAVMPVQETFNTMGKYRLEELETKRARAKNRRAKRSARQKERMLDILAKCHECGSRMTWCNGCHTYSQNCCVSWGTCYCKLIKGGR